MSVYLCYECRYPIADIDHLECVCCPKCMASCAAHKNTQVERLRERVAKLEAAGDLLYIQVLDSNAWLNYDGPNGSDLCICHEGKDIDPDNGLPPKPEVHDICCTPFRSALAAWRALQKPNSGYSSSRPKEPK